MSPRPDSTSYHASADDTRFALLARDWLLRLSGGLDFQTPVSTLLSILVGVWISEITLVSSAEESQSPSLARNLQRYVDNELGQPRGFRALLECDAALVLLAAGILRTMGSKCTTMNVFLKEVASAIPTARAGEEDAGRTSELFTSRFLLHKLRLHPEPEIYNFSAREDPYPSNLFLSDETLIRSLAADVAATTAYGQRAASMDPEFLEVLKYTLPTLTLFYLRQYNLEVGSLLLRSMHYLNLRRDRGFDMGLSFLLAQQQPDGRFGFMGPEIHRLRAIRPNMNDEVELYLPLTVSCLWTITELRKPHFNLFSSI